jgi:chromate transporter
MDCARAIGEGGYAWDQWINAAVVGLLDAAFYNPVWTSAVNTPVDCAIATAAFVLPLAWRAPPLLVVVASTAAGLGAALMH